MVKAVAERRGMEHSKHVHLFDVVDTLAQETGDSNLGTLFAAANGFHVNFYENWFTAAQVERRLVDIDAFVRKVEQLLLFE
jgi:hypothetical protein